MIRRAGAGAAAPHSGGTCVTHAARIARRKPSAPATATVPLVVVVATATATAVAVAVAVAGGA